VHQVPLRGTTLTSSGIGLGTHALHHLFSGRARQSLLSLGFDLGVRLFDTAPSYGGGIAERELGRFARTRRGQVLLSTKVGIRAGRLARLPGGRFAAGAVRALRAAAASGAPRQPMPPRDFGPAAVRASVENSLRALDTDCIDIVHLHEPTIELLGETSELARVLEQLRAGGKLRYVGLSCASGSEGARLARAHPGLAQVLQVEIARAADGLPAQADPLPQAGIRFLEFRARAADTRVREHLGRLAAALAAQAARGVLLLSSGVARELATSIELMQRSEAPEAGATSALA